MESKNGIIYAVGIGPGKKEYMTDEAIEAIEKADVVVAYSTYAKQIAAAFPNKKLEASGMRQEEDRVDQAISLAEEGKRVCLVSSGDAGVYGMAGLLFSKVCNRNKIEIKVVAGVTAASSGAARLGAPLANDFCVISLSDILTPWGIIEKRLGAAAEGGFVIVLYNAGSKARHEHLRRAVEIIAPYREAGTVCGIARKIGRDGEEIRLLSFKELADAPVDMETTVFIGNEDTQRIGDHMITLRGYAAEKQSNGNNA
ncbi:MAG: precorrin-3B C(17)-methyltransferase [Lachnospiraceae bacterium]|nr:precorrin-3B C(17)-methyltransferase [Lachnospiraceae bacterium]